MDNFIGEIKAFPYTYVPEYWLACNGQQLAVSQYAALYAVIGNLYVTPPNQQTFILPDLRGVVPVGATNGLVAQKGGTESVIIDSATTPAHNHIFHAVVVDQTMNLANATNTPTANSTSLTNSFYSVGTTPSGLFIYSNNAHTGNQLNPGSLSALGGNQGHENRMPFLPMNWAICWNGTFPVKPS